MKKKNNSKARSLHKNFFYIITVFWLAIFVLFSLILLSLSLMPKPKMISDDTAKTKPASQTGMSYEEFLKNYSFEIPEGYELTPTTKVIHKGTPIFTTFYIKYVPNAEELELLGTDVSLIAKPSGAVRIFEAGFEPDTIGFSEREGEDYRFEVISLDFESGRFSAWLETDGDEVFDTLKQFVKGIHPKEIAKDETWKWYTNNIYSFKYPSDWKIESEEKDHVSIRKSLSTDQGTASITIDTFENPSQLTLQQWGEQNKNAGYSKSDAKIRIDGVEAEVSEGAADQYYQYLVFLPTEDKVYRFKYTLILGASKEEFGRLQSLYPLIINSFYFGNPPCEGYDCSM